VAASRGAGGVQADSIYFMHRVFNNSSKEFFGVSMDPLADSGVYYMRDGTITALLPVKAAEQTIISDLVLPC